ncbi:Putative Isopropylmalate/homocitrate/citramalate synthases [Penicillium brasilianum]|uniref:hydroxymethylglutaryl-CoA lyase n=1 Tax=Penicillium brasilianum TaxID=104259 RepID=A0A0F7TJ36_PENBI|nr:Putative Isopropylmalate/homocitrate/citramalate synthases [Penicillium brasilianum]
MTIETPQVRIVEVGPRDGLQNIRAKVPTSTKLDLIHRLRDTGLRTIELTSVVSPRAIPQLADCREILGHASVKSLLQNNQAGLRFPVLVPNVKGLDIAVQHRVKEVAVFISATEGFSKANINCSVEQGIARATGVAGLATKAGVTVRGYVSCIFADPYDGPTPKAAVLHCVKSLLDAGCYEISLGDTLGVGSPSDVSALLKYLASHGIPFTKLAGHFHDTYGQAVANVWEAYTCGLRVFDSSVGGLGGCPFAPGAKGNVATEDLVYMFHSAGINTDVDLAKLVETGEWISQQLSLSNSSRAGKALSIKTRPQISAPKPSVSDPEQTTPLTWTLVSSPEGLLIHRNGPTLKITLNRPKNGNALTSPMLSTLTSTIQSANTDLHTTRIIITAVGRFFCTGMDLGRGSSSVAQGTSASDAQFARLTALYEALDTSPKVTIAALNGPAFGGGVGLAFACDIRLCVSGPACTLSEVKLGLAAATISRYVVREWGVPFAREAMLTARSVSAEELLARGLISGVAGTAAELEGQLDALLVKLKLCSPGGSRMSKELIRLAWVHGGKEDQAKGIKEVFDEMMRADGEGAVGLREFQMKRKMDWDKFVVESKPKL